MDEATAEEAAAVVGSWTLPGANQVRVTIELERRRPGDDRRGLP
jgi:hypothetical protein